LHSDGRSCFSTWQREICFNISLDIVACFGSDIFEAALFAALGVWELLAGGELLLAGGGAPRATHRRILHLQGAAQRRAALLPATRLTVLQMRKSNVKQSKPELVFLKGAQELIPRNRSRQPT
jgi:hypothetical protein